MTTFRFRCYRKLLKAFGESDAIIESAELAVRHLRREVSAVEDPVELIDSLAREYGVRVNTVDFVALVSRVHQLHLLAAYYQYEDYLEKFREEHPQSSDWESSDKKSLLKRILSNLDGPLSRETEFNVEILEYYRRVRNVLMHAEIRKDKYDPIAKRLKRHVQDLPKLCKFDAPNVVSAITFDDFVLFAKIAKDVAADLCVAGRPSDELIASMLKAHPAVKKARKLKDNPRRARHALITAARIEYSLEKTEAEAIADRLLEGTLA